MAKRDIPEINAGSRADIAFLLLLFFLVTTTMDKDMAYIRKIPQKLDVPPPDNIEIMERNILKIEANSQNKIKVREQYPDPSDISKEVIKFYTTNENNRDKNGVLNNFPQYTSANKNLCNREKSLLWEQVDAYEAAGDDDMVKYLKSAISQWDEKLKALDLLERVTGNTELIEIDKEAHIKIVVQKATTYAIYTQIHNEIEEALNELRNKKCEELFGEKYTIMKFRYNQTPEDNKEDKEKLDLIRILYPGKIIEVQPKN
jgi:biopolymer transport protein ExbD